MDQKETDELHDFLTTFQVDDLGHGDTHLGANVLASMATVLANLAPADSTILTHDGSPARLGVSLLINGSASSGLVLDEVITEVGRRQNNFARNLGCYMDTIEEQKGKQGARLPPMGPRTSSVVDAIAETQSSMDPLFGSRSEIWGRILNEMPPERLPSLAEDPKFLVTASRPGDLENQFQNLRPGPPLVYLGLGNPNDLVQLAEPAAALVEGRFALEGSCETVYANLLITDPMQMLSEAAKNPDARTTWLGHLLWLTDSEAGPEAPTLTYASDIPAATAQRFRWALDHVIALRLNLPKEAPTLLAKDLHKANMRWTAFLRKMEPSLPGISGSARNLITSLFFGLTEMARIEDRLSFSIAGVEAFARFLVRRMANARTMMMDAAEIAQRRLQIERVFNKLACGPVGTRRIYRNLSGFNADKCKVCLSWLEKEGIAQQVDDHWALVEGASLNFSNCLTPLLEI